MVVSLIEDSLVVSLIEDSLVVSLLEDSLVVSLIEDSLAVIIIGVTYGVRVSVDRITPAIEDNMVVMEANLMVVTSGGNIRTGMMEGKDQDLVEAS